MVQQSLRQRDREEGRDWGIKGDPYDLVKITPQAGCKNTA